MAVLVAGAPDGAIVGEAVTPSHCDSNLAHDGDGEVPAHGGVSDIAGMICAGMRRRPPGVGSAWPQLGGLLDHIARASVHVLPDDETGALCDRAAGLMRPPADAGGATIEVPYVSSRHAVRV